MASAADKIGIDIDDNNSIGSNSLNLKDEDISNRGVSYSEDSVQGTNIKANTIGKPLALQEKKGSVTVNNENIIITAAKASATTIGNPVSTSEDTNYNNNLEIPVLKEAKRHSVNYATFSSKDEKKVSGRSPDSDVSETEVSDDGTVSYFWQNHTFSVLVLAISILIYVVFFETEVDNLEYNVKRGIIAAMFAFLAFGVTQVKDGPVIRPHPALWRLVLCIALLYELFLVFLLFQTVSDARKLLVFVDPSLNKPIEFKSYGDTCTIWDPGHPDGPLHNVLDKMDIFVVAHLVGWFSKAIIFRDVWLTNVISFIFELLEYTFEYHLPNFFECWWDHWILDFVICNGLGIYLGLKVVKYLSIKEYRWRGLWHIRTYKGKMKRVVSQFSPYSWVRFRWTASKNLYKWLFVSLLIFISLLAEMNTFFLKYVLWISPSHPFVTIRLVLYTLWAFVGMREAYDFAAGKCMTFGQQAWILCAIVLTEFMVVCKFGWHFFSVPFPPYIKYFWLAMFIIYIALSIWKFQLRFPLLRQWLKESAKKWHAIVSRRQVNVLEIADHDSVSSSSEN